MLGGVVDQDVDTAEALTGLAHRRLHLALVRDVAAHSERRPVLLLYRGRRLLGRGLVDVGDRDRGALGGQRAAEGLAYTARAARDEGRLA